jgi:glutathione synthase
MTKPIFEMPSFRNSFTQANVAGAPSAFKMVASPYAEYPPSITFEQEEYILSTIKDWSIQRGLCVRPSSSFVPENIDRARVLATTAPITLFPSPFPKSCFTQAKSLQELYNELYSAISNDEDWMEEIIQG